MDLPVEQQTVSKEITESIVKLDWEAGFVECSAKDNVNIIDIFKQLLVQSNIKYNLSPAVRHHRSHQSSPLNAIRALSHKEALHKLSSGVFITDVTHFLICLEIYLFCFVSARRRQN